MRLAEPTGPSVRTPHGAVRPSTGAFTPEPPALGLSARGARGRGAGPIALSGLPDSIRLSSTIRPSVSSTATSVRVRPAAFGLAHLHLVVGLGGHLGQVGDHQHLGMVPEVGQGGSDRGGRGAADAGIDLVEDHAPPGCR